MKLDPLKLFPPVDFPVSRGTPIISNVIKWDHSDTWEVPKVDSGSNLGTSFEIDLSKNSEYRYFLDHQIDGRPVLPAAGYLVLAWKALANREERQWDQMPVMFEDVNIHRATLLVPDGMVLCTYKSSTPNAGGFAALSKLLQSHRADGRHRHIFKQSTWQINRNTWVALLIDFECQSMIT